MSLFVRVSFLVFIFGLFSLNTISAGEMRKEKREIADFTKIVISGSGHLLLKQGEKNVLSIETDPAFLPELKAEVIDNFLHLGPKNAVVLSNHRINYYLTVKNIDDIRAAGEIEVSSNNTISTKVLNLLTEGAGTVNLKIKAHTLKVRVEGSGNIVLAGNVVAQALKIEGAGKIQGKKLLAKATQVDIKGSGIAEVNASETLDVKIEGFGTVKYYGEPKITQEISGAGEIVPLE